MKVTVGIKALNEEKHIAAALAGALKAIEPWGSEGEVVLADSGSEDRTVEIARQFPVRIVQFADPSERCCGASAQLAFQHAEGEYFYLMDGDMVLDPRFLQAGIAYLQAHPDTAAVGGRVQERNVANEEFQIRAKEARQGNWAPGPVDHLNGGGLYRTDAVRQVGYFADRNLHAFEEFDLGARLQAAGWNMARIDELAVEHFGHTAGGYALLRRRIRSGYASGPGEVLRAAWGQKHMRGVLERLGHVRNGLAVIAWWFLLAISLFVWPLALPVLLLVPLAFLAWRRGSLRLGIYSMVSWNVSAWGLIAGLFHPRKPPEQPMDALELQRPPRG